MFSEKIVETFFMNYLEIFIKNLPIDFNLDILAV